MDWLFIADPLSSSVSRANPRSIRASSESIPSPSTFSSMPPAITMPRSAFFNAVRVVAMSQLAYKRGWYGYAFFDDEWRSGLF